MPHATRLASIDDLKAFLKGDTPPSLDGLLGTILDGVSVRFARLCHRQDWSYAPRVEYFSHRAPMGRRLDTRLIPLTRVHVAHPPIDLAESITVADDPLRLFGVETELDPSFYVVDSEAGAIELDGRSFSHGIRHIRVTYTGGYLTEDGVSGAPEFPGLKMLALLQSAFLYQRRGELGLVGRSLEGGSVSIEAQLKLLPEVLDGLRSFMPLRLV
jgi:hypothetical protein